MSHCENFPDGDKCEVSTDRHSTDNPPTAIHSSSSKALVPYEDYPLREIPTSIQWLGPDLDLKIPPHNWLRTKSPIEKYIQRALYGKNKRSNMSSISMAESKVEDVDSIDVISDAKNIKSLLEIPFAKDKPISLMIHRVGKTLLIDEFDIHKHLIRKQKDDWSWLKKFYTEMVLNGEISRVPHRSQQTHKKLLHQNMFSKFLYYSIMEQEPEHLVPTQDEVVTSPPKYTGTTDTPADSQDDKEMYRQVHEWQFEDIKMLIGSDLPIFTDGSSCVSLRLRETGDPITVLTGLDYWLDNLMCNVPEIVMCYHLGGFVQKYERFSTSDIPNIKGSEFKPEFITYVAQNILSFLRSNATQVGHTYWLYKAQDDDLVKLYDLTSLTGCEQSRENPFRHPLAVLLFKVALTLHKKRNPAKSGVIQTLLTNSLTLATETNPEVEVTAHLILSELHLQEEDDVSGDTESQDSETELQSTESTSDEDAPPTESASQLNLAASGACGQVDISSLYSTQPDTSVTDFSSQFPPITGSQESRCETAINHISQGLLLVDKDILELEKKSDKMENLPKTSTPSVAIPLPYKPLDADKSKEPEVERVINRLRLTANTWHRQSKAGLLSKAMFSFHSLAFSTNLVMEHGKGLKYCKLAFLCYDALSVLDAESMANRNELLQQVIELCGDIQLNITAKSRKMSVYRREYDEYSSQEKTILDSALLDIPVENYSLLYTWYDDPEQALLVSLQCYEKVKDSKSSTEKSKILITKRLGNCCNEIASFYINKVVKTCAENEGVSEEDMSGVHRESESYASTAAEYVQKALKYFRCISDKCNVAMILCNSAKLCRARTMILPFSPDGFFYGLQEKQLYKQATENYLEALAVLEKKETLPEIWDTINFELSGIYFTIASLLQDNHPSDPIVSREQVEREVTDLMGKSLKYCNLCQSHPSVIGNRKAVIHHRLASLNHHAYRQCAVSQENSMKMRRLRTLTISHYDKSIAYYLAADTSFTNSLQLLRVLIEKSAFYEFEYNNYNTSQTMLKQAVSVLLDDSVGRCLQGAWNVDMSESEGDNPMKLLTVYSEKLQNLLKALVREASAPKTNPRKARKEQVLRDGLLVKYKEMYKISLSINIKEQSFNFLCKNILKAYTETKQIFSQL